MNTDRSSVDWRHGRANSGRRRNTSSFGPEMRLATTASRFDNSSSCLAVVGDEAPLSVFESYGPDVIYGRNRELEDLVRSSLSEVGWMPVELPPVDSCSERDGNLRLAVHSYNHADDIHRLTHALEHLAH